MTPTDISWKKELPSSYGPITAPSIPSSLLSYANSLTWQGKQQDPTGFIHFGARYYDPQSGRFLSPDPIGYPIPLNLYSYTNGDPVNFHDPDGRFESPVYDSSPATNISIGFLHGLAEMATDNIQFMHYVNGIASGGNLSEVDRVYSYHRNSLESYVTNQFSIDPQDSYYQNSRTVARWAANIFAVAKVGFSLGKMAIVEGPAVIRSGFATVRSLFSEIKLVKEANFVRSGAENVKKASRNRFSPDINAVGDHTVFRRDPLSSRVSHYETYRLQTNPKDPKPWESLKRYDGPENPHYHFNKVTEERVYAPHIHDPFHPGGVRSPEKWEIPN